jgi:hydrogenase maturation factor HypF (carbamoyltransferase family)
MHPSTDTRQALKIVALKGMPSLGLIRLRKEGKGVARSRARVQRVRPLVMY